MHYAGLFHGYRELAAISAKLRRGVRLYAPPPRTRLAWFHWDLLGPVPYDYRVYAGYADDEFSDYVYLPFMSRLVLCSIHENDAILQFMYNEATECPKRLFEIGFERVEAVIAFRIKNAVPGNVARYQIAPMV
jgi:hypothetical protein